ncbi:MAG: biotin-dependent carboxyltransferase family protein [Synergistaceae bacterium]|nr:biotin-dependent carboxyltransferase family protein [Synergistaceae bacterium]
MELIIRKAGMLTSVQDLGRWGYQSSGVPVAGAMDLPALRLGNAMLGNPEDAAALEVTLFGPDIEVKGAGAAVFAGADLGFSVNGKAVGSWRAVVLNDGDLLTFKGPKGKGCRGNLCFAGGVDILPVMNSRSTYMRAKIGGVEGRALKKGDVIKIGEPAALWKRLDGFCLPDELDPKQDTDAPLAIIMGLQEDAFTEEGKNLLFDSEYTVTAESDRMGCRLEGAKIEHTEKGADIVSDVIPLGAVQIPGHGMPIIMLADRQTTGGYTKIGVLSPLSIEALVQKLPGSKVRFRRADASEGVTELKKIKDAVYRVKELHLSYVFRTHCKVPKPLSSHFMLTFEGKRYDVTCEEI